MEKTLNNWKRRKLTLLGKISIVKSVGLLPVPKNLCDQVNKVTFNFIWDNKIAKIKKKTIIGERRKRRPKFERFCVNEQSLKVHLDKAISPERELDWTVVPNEATSHFGGLTFLSICNCNSKDLNIEELPLLYERML